MIRMFVALLMAGSIAPTAGPPAASSDDVEPRVFRVEMVDISPTEFAFQPAEIRARPGDVVRFVQVGMMPHNVEFREVPEGARLDDVKMGPFLLQKEETYDIVVDERFVPGTYPFLCTPHEMLGMKGTLIVEDPETSDPQEVNR